MWFFSFWIYLFYYSAFTLVDIWFFHSINLHYCFYKHLVSTVNNNAKQRKCLKVYTDISVISFPFISYSKYGCRILCVPCTLFVSSLNQLDRLLDMSLSYHHSWNRYPFVSIKVFALPLSGNWWCNFLHWSNDYFLTMSLGWYIWVRMEFYYRIPSIR